MKGKRKKNADALKAPEKFIKQYQAQQKSYSHYKLKVKFFPLRIEKTCSWSWKEDRDPSMAQADCF